MHHIATTLHQNTSAETMRRDAVFTPLHKISTRIHRSARIICISVLLSLGGVTVTVCRMDDLVYMK